MKREEHFGQTRKGMHNLVYCLPMIKYHLHQIELVLGAQKTISDGVKNTKVKLGNNINLV